MGIKLAGLWAWGVGKSKRSGPDGLFVHVCRRGLLAQGLSLVKDIGKGFDLKGNTETGLGIAFIKITSVHRHPHANKKGVCGQNNKKVLLMRKI